MNRQDTKRTAGPVPEALHGFPRSVLRHLEEHQLAAHEFTALFPVSHSARAGVREALDSFDAETTLRRIAGLHSARWALLTSLDSETCRSQPSALVFAFIADGNALDVLDQLADSAAHAFDPILKACPGYPGSADAQAWVDYVRRHRVRSGYLFRDTRQLDPSAGHLHASAEEIRHALALRSQFRSFVVAHQGAPPADVQAAFRREFMREHDLESVYPFALSSAEQRVEHEGLWLRRIAELARTRARRDARARRRAGVLPAGLRGVHAKHHGLVEARLRVRNDLPRDLQHGILVPGANYRAWLRLSNSSARPRSDARPDARGLSIKVLDVGGPRLWAGSSSDELGPPEDRVQDFALVSHPTFFLHDARDYALLRSFLDARTDGWGERALLLLGVGAFAMQRPREALIFARTQLRSCVHPLLLEYHSMLPFQLGPGRAVKFSVRPDAKTRALLRSHVRRGGLVGADRGRDRLSVALGKSLARDDTLELEVAVHLPGHRPLPVEDPRLDWSALGARRVVVATLSIPTQDCTSSQRMAHAECLVMTPWHTLQAHRPLGSLNRARLGAYLASAQERRRANGVPSASGSTSEMPSAAE